MQKEQRYISSYHHNDCLLFQFLLAEFLCAYKELPQLKSLYRELAEGCEQKKQRRLYKKLAISLEALSGTTQEYMRIFSWNQNGGFLKKIMTYSTQLSDITASKNADALKVQRYANKAWVHCLHCHDLLLLRNKQTEKDKKELLSALEEIQKSLKMLARVAVAMITEYQDDENVLFFILRHKEQFDKLFGKRFVSKLFSKLFPKGLSNGKRFLIRRYKKRGFDDLEPIIAQKITELETA
ncbi:MAG: hypothetical protein H7A37_07655 [Chlamydiales bacterium]|nr:hypothetical protein [Chlamydiia bacterium]MCP5508160.1 hypothetical protein [Chlamydiales bacterium]